VSPSYVILFFVPPRRSAAFLFHWFECLDCVGSVALGNVGMSWEVDTSSVACQGGYYALRFDENLTAIQIADNGVPLIGVWRAYQVDVLHTLSAQMIMIVGES
jgi:hypothetical protein